MSRSPESARSSSLRRLLKSRRRSRPKVEQLERLMLLSTFTVDSLLDDGVGETLRQAVVDANADTTSPTVINFDAGAVSVTVLLVVLLSTGAGSAVPDVSAVAVVVICVYGIESPAPSLSAPVAVAFSVTLRGSRSREV